MGKSKVLISGSGLNVLQKSGKDPFGVCLKGVSTNYIFCDGCSSWIHKKCSGIPGHLKSDVSFRCKQCTGQVTPTDGRLMREVAVGREKLSLFHTPTGSRICLYMASLVSLTDVLIGWPASDYDAPIWLLHIQINTGNTMPSSTWRASPTWRKQKAFPLLGTVAMWVFWKSRELPAFFRGHSQSYARWNGTWNSLGEAWGGASLLLPWGLPILRWQLWTRYYRRCRVSHGANSMSSCPPPPPAHFPSPPEE